MKRLLFVFTVLLLAGTTEVYSQGWLEKVAKKTAKRVEERSKKKVEDKVNEAADKTVDKAFGKAEDAVTGKGNNGGNDTGGNDGEAATESTVGGNEKMIPKSLEMTLLNLISYREMRLFSKMIWLTNKWVNSPANGIYYKVMPR